MSQVEGIPRTLDFRALLALTPDILFLLERDEGRGAWIVRFVNRAIRKLGYQENAITGRPFSEIFDPAYRPVLDQTLGAFRGKEMRLQMPVRVRTRSGKMVTGSLGLVLLRVNNQPRGYAILTVRSSRNVVERILNGVDVGILLVDDRGRIRYANRYARHLFEENLSVLPREFWQIRKKNEPVEVPWKDRFLGVSVYPAGDKSHKEWLYLIKDITEKKWVQETLVRLDRFSSFGVIASGLAHEIKNPLAGMRLIAQNLARRLEDERDREALERMLRQIDRIDTLIKQFFSYVKPKEPHPESIRVREVIDDLYPLIKDQLMKHRITFNVEVPESIRIRVDRHQFEQILLNLMLNAIEAMPHKGTLTVLAREVHQKLPRMERERWVEIVVQDTGVGMTPEQLEHIFVPFFTTKPSGTGLGLFIVHQLVTRNGGLIRAESKKNHGTRFILYMIPGDEGG